MALLRGFSRATDVSSVAAADGTPLAIRRWVAADDQSVGTVLIVHGLGEHGGRYAEVAARVAGWGWNVVAHDHRGHGLSGGTRGGIQHPDDLVRDLATVIDAVRPDAPAPLVLLGHSMGGAVAADLVACGLRAVDALVLSSPALRPLLPPSSRALLAAARAIAPRLPLPNRLDWRRLSHDPDVVRAYRADPLVHGRVSALLASYVIDAGERVRAAAARWMTPTLLVWAGDDHLVNAEGSEEFARLAPADVVESRRFAAFYHEILNEPDAGPLFDLLRDWLARHT